MYNKRLKILDTAEKTVPLIINENITSEIFKHK